MFGSLVARKLVLWLYSSCMVCRDVWRRKHTMEDDAKVLERNWICLARLTMLHCVSPIPPNFVGRNTRALLIFDDIWSLPSNAPRVGLCIESICFCVNHCRTTEKPINGWMYWVAAM